MAVVLGGWGALLGDERVAARARLLDGPGDGDRPGWPLPPPVAAWEIHDLLGEMSSGTKPCTSCCTQCSSNCCNATC